jgi:hypothetical protein
MAERKRPQLDAGLITRKGEATPAVATDGEKKVSQTTSIPKGTKNTIAVTVRLDAERYKRLIAYGARFAPRRKNQEILVEALDSYLENVE